MVSGMRARAIQARRRWVARSRRIASIGSVVPLGLAFAFVVATFFAVSARNDAASRAQVDGRAARLDAAMAPLGNAYLREFTLLGQAALGFPADEALAVATQQREEQRNRALRRLDALARGDDSVADVARQLTAKLREQQGDDSDGQLLALWDDWAILDGLASDQGSYHTPTRDSLGALAQVGQTPWLVTSDMVDAEYVRLEPDVPASTEDYFARSGPYVLGGEAGWLSDDRDDPFSGEWVPRDLVRRHLPHTESALVDVLGSPEVDDLVRLDRWVKAWAERAQGPPPLSFTQATAVADRLDRRLSRVVNTGLRDRVARSERTVTDAERDRWLTAGAGAIAVLVCLLTQVAIARRHQRRWIALTEASETDDMTGLTNRRGLERRVPPRLADPDRASHVLVQVDLDRFKAVNDTYGHKAGDTVLRAFAACARTVVEDLAPNRDSHELARIGGDEFLIVLHDCVEPRAEAEQLIEALEASLKAPVSVGDAMVDLAVSGGVAITTGPAALADLLAEADVALYQAKSEGQRGFRFFDEPLLREILRDFPTHARLGAVEAHLQPQVDLETGHVVAYEALARWTRGDRLAVAAGQWVSIVEQMGASGILFDAMARSSALALEQLGNRFHGRVWLNLAPPALAEHTAADSLLASLDAVGLPPTRVGVEIVETAGIVDLEVAARNLDRLRSAGIAVALDDFGSGFTPIGHLTALPIDLIKLDRSMIAAVDERPRQAALVAAMVTVAASLGIALIAEGIETVQEMAALRSLGVTLGQGYLLGRPAPATDFLLPSARPSRRAAPEPAGITGAVMPPVAAPA